MKLKPLTSVLIFIVLLCDALATCAQAAASVTVAWDPSITPNVTYRVTVNGTITVDAGSATSVSVPNLTGGTAYTFACYAVDTNGVWSVPSNVVTFTPSDGVPPAPIPTSRSILRLADGSYRITVTWNPVASSYVVTNYLLIAQIGTLSYTNQAGTNLTAALTVPNFSAVNTYLQSQNNQAFSTLGFVVGYTQPGKSGNLKVTQP